MSKPEPAAAEPSQEEQSQPTATESRGLIVFVRGLHPFFPRKALYQRIEQLLKDKLPNHDLYSLEYLGTYWSSADPEKLARRLEEEVRKKTAENKYTQLYLVGHSFGALLLRQAILYAAELTEQTDDWLRKVKRVILLAGANRGFQPYTGLLELIASFGTLLQRLPLIPPFLRFGPLAVYGLSGSVWTSEGVKSRIDWLQSFELIPTSCLDRSEFSIPAPSIT